MVSKSSRVSIVWNGLSAPSLTTGWSSKSWGRLFMFGKACFFWGDLSFFELCLTLVSLRCIWPWVFWVVFDLNFFELYLVGIDIDAIYKKRWYLLSAFLLTVVFDETGRFTEDELPLVKIQIHHSAYPLLETGKQTLRIPQDLPPDWWYHIQLIYDLRSEQWPVDPGYLL